MRNYNQIPEEGNMQIEMVPFDVWFYATKNKLTPELISVLNPFNGSFCRIGDCYLQLSFPVKGTICVDMAISFSPVNWTSVLLRWARRMDAEKFVFYTAENNEKVKTIAKYWGFKLKAVENNFYGPGKTAYFYEIDLNDYGNKRIW
jgi:hypothetical protein